MNEGELHLQRMRDQLCAKKDLTDDESQMLQKLNVWHRLEFQAMLAYSDLLDTWARQQLRDVDPFPNE